MSEFRSALAQDPCRWVLSHLNRVGWEFGRHCRFRATDQVSTRLTQACVPKSSSGYFAAVRYRIVADTRRAFDEVFHSMLVSTKSLLATIPLSNNCNHHESER